MKFKTHTKQLCQAAFSIMLLSACATTPKEPAKLDKPTVRQLAPSKLTETVTRTQNGSDFTAIATFRRFTAADVNRHSFWLGSIWGNPDYLLAKLTVIKDGKETIVPPHLFSDFGDTGFHGKYLNILNSDSASDYTIKFYGSDGVNSYDAEFIFEKDRLDRAVVASSGFARDGVIGRVKQVRKP